MALNYIFVGFFFIAFFVAIYTFCSTGDWAVFSRLMTATFDQSKNGFEISLYLTGVLSFWLGLLKIAERSGLIHVLGRWSAPILTRLFPSVPKDHPAMGNIFMNISANVLGLDNAATPLGLNTMKSLQELNARKETPSDAMLMFIALNASGLTVIPTSIIAFRLQAGAINPADVFFPILLSTTASTLVAVLLVGLKQRINLLCRPILLFLLALGALFGGILYASRVLPTDTFRDLSTGVSSLLLLAVIMLFFIAGLRKRVNVYDAFIDGAKEGFSTAVGIIPYLVAMLVGIGVFRASGAMDLILEVFRWLTSWFVIDNRWVEALPTMLMKPLSGSGARALMVDAMQTHGADSFIGRLSCTIQGATDTIFYVVALYLGSIGVKRPSYVLSYSLLADLAGVIVAVCVTYLFFS